MKRNYFGTNGIRSKANEKINLELALNIGHAAGLIFRGGEGRS